MEGLKTNEAVGYLPAVVITAHPGHKLQALQAGAEDFVSKPFDIIEVKTRIRNNLEVRLLYKKLESYSELLEQTALERTAELRESETRYRSLTELAADSNAMVSGLSLSHSSDLILSKGNVLFCRIKTGPPLIPLEFNFA